MRRQNLDRDGAIKPRIPCAIHLAHPACAKRRLDFIRPEFGPRCEPHALRVIIVPGETPFILEPPEALHSEVDSSHHPNPRLVGNPSLTGLCQGCSSSGTNHRIARSRLPAWRSLFIELGGPVQDDRHGRGLGLLDLREDQKSLPVSANVINEEVPTRSWLPEIGLE